MLRIKNPSIRRNSLIVVMLHIKRDVLERSADGGDGIQVSRLYFSNLFAHVVYLLDWLLCCR